MKNYILSKLVLSLLPIFILAGCATSYQPMGATGGYSEMALSKDVYKVVFKGNVHSSQDQVQDYMLRRCAQLTVQNNYKYFIVIKDNTNIEQSTVVIPATVESNTSGNFSTYGNYGNYNQNTRSMITPASTMSVNKYKAIAIIKMLETNKNNPQAFDASIILSNFKK